MTDPSREHLADARRGSTVLARVGNLHEGSARATARPLTNRQREVLRYIDQYQEAMGFAPTSRELAKACGLGSPSGAHRMLGVLEQKGFLERSPGRSRSIKTLPFSRCLSLGTVNQLVALATGAGQRMARNAELAITPHVHTAAIQETLMRGALRRHSHAEAISEGLSGFDDPQRSAVEAMITSELAEALIQPSWLRFVVSSMVFNEYSARTARRLCEDDTELASVVFPNSDICQRASNTAQDWLDSTLEREPLDEIQSAELVHHCRQALETVASTTTELIKVCTSIDPDRTMHGGAEEAITQSPVPAGNLSSELLLALAFGEQ